MYLPDFVFLPLCGRDVPLRGNDYNFSQYFSTALFHRSFHVASSELHDLARPCFQYEGHNFISAPFP